MRVEYNSCRLHVARRLCPWAVKHVRVSGGYMSFESIEDYEIWRKQK